MEGNSIYLIIEQETGWDIEDPDYYRIVDFRKTLEEGQKRFEKEKKKWLAAQKRKYKEDFRYNHLFLFLIEFSKGSKTRLVLNDLDKDNCIVWVDLNAEAIKILPHKPLTQLEEFHVDYNGFIIHEEAAIEDVFTNLNKKVREGVARMGLNPNEVSATSKDPMKEIIFSYGERRLGIAKSEGFRHTFYFYPD